jgi:hypothetical protein
MYGVCFITARVPINKKDSADLRGNYDVNYDEIYDEIYDAIHVKTVSKCLDRMNGCWDPEFEPIA